MEKSKLVEERGDTSELPRGQKKTEGLTVHATILAFNSKHAAGSRGGGCTVGEVEME